MNKKLGIMRPAESILLVCDIQERFRTVAHKFDSVARTSKLLVEGCKALDVPILATEQYPKALGRTIPELEGDFPRLEKMEFSMMCKEVRESLDRLGADRNYLICGLEAHVCVLQTVLDLLAAGNNVHVIVDAVSSSRPLDRAVALTRMAEAGAFLTTAESALFMLMGSANHSNFKTVSGLVKEYGKNPSELDFNGAKM